MAITETIPSITGYTGTVPDKATQTKTDFANSVNPYLNYVDNTFIPSYETAKAALNVFATQANALATAVNSDALNAAAAATSALLTANSVAWVSGTTYALNDDAISQIDFQTYRRIIAGAGTTDPSADPTNWVKLGFNGGAVTSEILANAGLTITGDLAFTQIDKGTVSTGTVTFTQSDGNVQRLQVGGALTIATAGWHTTGSFSDLLIHLVNGGSAVVTMPTINWVKPDGTVTTTMSTYMTAISRTAFQTSGVDFIYLWTVDGGTTIYGKLV